MTADQSTEFFDFDFEFFIVVPFFELFDEYLEVGECFEVDEDAAFAMFGFGAEVDTDALTVGYVTNLRHHLLESWRPRHSERVRPSGYQKLRILKRLVRQRRFEGKNDFSGQGVSLYPFAC